MWMVACTMKAKGGSMRSVGMESHDEVERGSGRQGVELKGKTEAARSMCIDEKQQTSSGPNFRLSAALNTFPLVSEKPISFTSGSNELSESTV
ncbi:uncharacterized protein MEPE_06450 [Melanopsichium pennsylvanicum]|uniref:Uncharacterized protein n=1 Tax=Melanopsichium pennsylvanicum TaxID=63383 RepID=A0AAJ4XRW9_9BASI|nr:uncharacterized protein MEPE_06450 [Melanopsichium pennsylvanicum]